MKNALLQVVVGIALLAGCGSAEPPRTGKTRGTAPPPRRITIVTWSTEKDRYVETTHEGWPTVTEEREKK